MAPTFKLLYVCNGDDARSPLAAACTKQLFTGKLDDIRVEIDSAGTDTVAGLPLRDEAAVAATELGLDLSAHASRELTTEMCGEYDLVLGMSWEHVSHIWSVVPKSWDCVFTMKEFVYWAKQAPARPPILFADRLEQMRDKIQQAHAIRKRARADHGFWGGIRPQDLNLIEPNGKGEDAWKALAKAVHALSTDVITLLRGPELKPAPSKPAQTKLHRPARTRAVASAKKKPSKARR